MEVTSSRDHPWPIDVASRKSHLLKFLLNKRTEASLSARSFDVAWNVLFLLSLAFGIVASFLGVVAGPSRKIFALDITPATVSGFAAIGTALQVALRQSMMSEKALWNYKRSDRIGRLVRQLLYRVKEPIEQADIDHVVEQYDMLEENMLEEADFLRAEAQNTGPGRGGVPRKRKARATAET